MHILKDPAPDQSSSPASPIISVNRPPSSSIAEPSTLPTHEVSPDPPKIATPQRTRRQETPPPTTATRLRSHITPTKRADSVMLRAQEMRLALLPPAQQPPPPPAVPSTHTSVQPEGVPPTPRVIPPTPMQRPGDVSHYEGNYAESRGSRYPSPGDSRQSPIYQERRLMYNTTMPPVDPRNNYS